MVHAQKRFFHLVKGDKNEPQGVGRSMKDALHIVPMIPLKQNSLQMFYRNIERVFLVEAGFWG